MYDTGNEDFISAACNYNRIIDTQIVLNIGESTTTLDTEDIVTYKIVSSCISGKSFTPGNFVASNLDLSLNASSTSVSSIDFKNVVISSLDIKAGIQVSSTMVYVPMGRYYINNDGIILSDDGFVNIKATNIPKVMYTRFNSESLNLPQTVADCLSQISTSLGFTVAYGFEFANKTVSVDETFALTTTYREALMYFAELLGGYVCMDRTGNIYIDTLYGSSVNIGCTLDDNYLYSVVQQESIVKPFQYIRIKANKDDVGVTKEVTGVTTTCTYDIIDNPLSFGHPEDFLDGLVSPTSFTEFHPTKLSFQGRPDIDLSDVISYVYKNTTYLLPVCTHTFEYNGGFKTTLESNGSDSLYVSSVDSSVKSKVTAIKQNINTLIRDLAQTQSQIVEINGEVTQLSTLLQTVEQIQSQITNISTDIEQISTLTQTADQLRIDLQTVVSSLSDVKDSVDSNQNLILSYFDFQSDGLTIGVSNSELKLRLSNDRISFFKGSIDNEVAYISDSQLYITDGHFLKFLVLGNFEFVPRTNGNLSLRRRS